MMQGMRFWLALFRLGVVLTAISLLAVALGLQRQHHYEIGATLHQPFPPFQAPATQIPFLGINVQLEQYSSDERQAALTRLRAADFGWVRQRFDWGQLEPQPGQLEWQRSDEILRDIVKSDLIPVIILDGSPAWSRATEDRSPHDNPFAPPADPTTFAKFAKRFAQRYGDILQFYQIWDEPNIAPHWGNRHIEPVHYAQLLSVSSAAIRQADPDAVVILAALAPTADRGHTAIDEPYFLQRLYATDAAPYFDVVAIQPFGFGKAADDRHQQIQTLNFRRAMLIRRVMLAAGDGETPIWAVRYGWNTDLNSPWRTVAPEDQRAFAADALTIANDQWPWLTAMGWMIDQPALPPDDPIWGFALTDALAGVLKNWQMRDRQTFIIDIQPIVLNYFLLTSLILIFIWRGWWAGRLLPWDIWLQRYRTLPDIYQILAWSFLLIIYYLATWPPLILFCWMIAAFWILAKPTVGIYLAIFCLPLHFQHKEFTLFNTHWIIPPTQAILLCLLPTLFSHLVPMLRAGMQTRYAASSALLTSLQSQRDAERPQDIPTLRVGMSFTSVFDGLALAYLLISLISIINVWHWSGYWRGMLDLVLVPLLLYTAIRTLLKTDQQRKNALYSFVFSGLSVAFIGLWQWGQGMGTDADGIQRLVGTHFSPNHTALYLERTFFVGLGLAFALKGNLRNGFFLLSGVIAIALLLTASRGAWLLGVPVGLLYIGWYWVQSNNELVGPSSRKGSQVLSIAKAFLTPSWKIQFVATLGAVGGIFYIFWERLTNSATVLERFSIWASSIQLWKAYPFFGVGPGGFFWNYPAYIPINAAMDPNLRHPHNLWLEFGTTWGWLGIVWLCSLLWMIWSLIKRKQQSWTQTGLIASLIAGLAHAQVDSFLSLADLAGWHWGIIGIYVTLRSSFDDGRAMLLTTLPFRRHLRNFLPTRWPIHRFS